MITVALAESLPTQYFGRLCIEISLTGNLMTLAILIDINHSAHASDLQLLPSACMCPHRSTENFSECQNSGRMQDSERIDLVPWPVLDCCLTAPHVVRQQCKTDASAAASM
jgi:hypothetical protein